MRRPPPPVPPPDDAHPVFIAVAAVWAAVYLMLLIRLARGQIIVRPVFAYYAWPWTLGVFIFLKAFGYQLFPDILRAVTKNANNDDLMVQILIFLMPVTGFALLLFGELSSLFFSLSGPRAPFSFLRQPMMAIHAISFYFYLIEPSRELRAVTDIFGRPLYPLRYVMWNTSVSCMVLSIFYVVQGTLRQFNTPEATHVSLHAELSHALIGSFITFTAGGLGSARLPMGGESVKLLNALLLLLSFSGFYVMLSNVTCMLGRAQRIVPTLIRHQFQVLRTLIVLIWHSFPVVWLLAAAGAISIEQEHVGYVCSDLLAKHLLLFMYAQKVNI